MAVVEQLFNPVVMGLVPHGPVQELTPRQFEEIDQGSLGYNRSQRADIRVVSTETIKSMRSHGIRKLAAFNLEHATRVGFEQGILKPSLNLDPADYQGLLGPVQIQELILASYGLSSPAAAAIRGVSPTTTKENRKIIREKLEARTMPHAVRIAIEAKIIPIEFEVELEASVAPETITDSYAIAA